MILCFPEYHASFSGLNVVEMLCRACFFIICSKCVILYKYQFVMPSSDTAAFEVTSHICNFFPHPRWFLRSIWGLKLSQISSFHNTWCFSVLPGCTQMAQWEEAIQMCSASKARLQMASQIWDIPAFEWSSNLACSSGVLLILCTTQ